MKLVPEYIDEAMSFQRGRDPKRALGLGILGRLEDLAKFLEDELSWNDAAVKVQDDGSLIYTCMAGNSVIGDIKEVIEKFGWGGMMRVNIDDDCSRTYSDCEFHTYRISFKAPLRRKFGLSESLHFQRGLDPKEALGIGRLSNVTKESIHNAFACARNYSLEDLENIYKRIRAKSNISLDGVPIEKLPNFDWVEFNNKVVNGIKALRRRRTKERSPFKPGDLLKVVHRGKTYFGIYDSIDKNGRIKAKGHKIKLAFNPESYSLATPEEAENYRIEGIKVEKQMTKIQIQRLKGLISMGYPKQPELESLLATYEKKFGEKYEG